MKTRGSIALGLVMLIACSKSGSTTGAGSTSASTGSGGGSGSATGSGTSSGSGGSGGGKLCGAPDGNCAACFVAHCNDAISACMGPNWQTQDGGDGAPCTGMYACLCACEKNGGGKCDPAMCAAQIGQACQSCFAAFAPCMTNTCASACK